MAGVREQELRMTVRLVGLNCSPRDKSNSGILLERSFDALMAAYPGEAECEAVNLRELHIEPCKACNVCGKTKESGKFIRCVREHEDDVQNVLDKMVAADGMVVATPVYFGLPSDLFSKFIMRTRPLRHQDFKLANRPVGVMATAGRRSGGAETTIIATWLPFVRNGCLVVGNGDATCQFGAYGWAGARGHILSDEWGMEQGYQTVERVFTMARIIKAGIEATGFANPMKFSYSSGTRP
jgi:multimeric flavodoxin WrbA